MVAVTGQERAREGDAGPPRRPSALLWIIAGVVAAALVIGAVASALRDAAPLPAGSPERTVQDYLQAVFDGDVTDARGHLSAASARSCSAGDYRRAWVPESLTASLDDVQVRDGDAEVHVRLRSVAGPEPFAGGGFAAREAFVLTREDGGWRLTGEPWPVLDCGALR